MRIAVTVSTKDAHPAAMVVFRGIEENLRRIADLGYDGVEIAVFDRSNVDVRGLKKLLKEYGLEVPVLSTGQIYTFRNLSFTHPRGEVRGEAVAAFKEVIDLAGELGADVNTSRMRGSLPETGGREEALRHLTECLEELCGYAGRRGVNLLIEQMNRYETNYFLSVPDVGEYIRGARIRNLKLHPDTFHMNIEDADPVRALTDYMDILGYIHFADSNRLAPGRGHLDFPSIFRALEEGGYGGWIGVEVLPRPTPEEAAGQSIRFIREHMTPGARPEGGGGAARRDGVRP